MKKAPKGAFIASLLPTGDPFAINIKSPSPEPAPPPPSRPTRSSVSVTLPRASSPRMMAEKRRASSVVAMDALSGSSSLASNEQKPDPDSGEKSSAAAQYSAAHRRYSEVNIRSFPSKFSVSGHQKTKLCRPRSVVKSDQLSPTSSVEDDSSGEVLPPSSPIPVRSSPRFTRRTGRKRSQSVGSAEEAAGNPETDAVRVSVCAYLLKCDCFADCLVKACASLIKSVRDLVYFAP